MSATKLISELQEEFDRVGGSTSTVNSFLSRWQEAQALLTDATLDPKLARAFRQLKQDVERIEMLLHTSAAHQSLQGGLLAAVDSACRRPLDLSWVNKYPVAHAFFLANIRYPFPSKRTLELLAKQSFCTVPELKTWFSRVISKLGYGVIRDTFCGGDRRLLRSYLKQVLVSSDVVVDVPHQARESILCLKRRAETLLNPPPKKSLVSQVIIQNMGSRVSSQPASDQSDQSPSKEGVARSRKRKLPTEAPANDMPTVPETSSIERRRKRRKENRVGDQPSTVGHRCATIVSHDTEVSPPSLDGPHPSPSLPVQTSDSQAAELPTCDTNLLLDPPIMSLPDTNPPFSENPFVELFDPKAYQASNLLAEGLETMDQFTFDIPDYAMLGFHGQDLPPYSQEFSIDENVCSGFSKESALIIPDIDYHCLDLQPPSYLEAYQLPPDINSFEVYSV